MHPLRPLPAPRKRALSAPCLDSQPRPAAPCQRAHHASLPCTVRHQCPMVCLTIRQRCPRVQGGRGFGVFFLRRRQCIPPSGKFLPYYANLILVPSFVLCHDVPCWLAVYAVRGSTHAGWDKPATFNRVAGFLLARIVAYVSVVLGVVEKRRGRYCPLDCLDSLCRGVQVNLGKIRLVSL